MPSAGGKIVARKFVRVRERNQITLPNEIISGLPIHVGDFLEMSRTEDGNIHLKPTVLVTVNSPEARQQESLADEDIANHRYKTFKSAADLMEDVKQRRKRKEKVAAAKVGKAAKEKAAAIAG